MSLENFLNPLNENTMEKTDENKLILSLLSDYLLESNEEVLEKLDNEVIEIPEPILTVSDVIQAIQTALRYAKFQKDISIKEIRDLMRLEQLFGRLSIENQHQTRLEAFWNS